jgi:hypothetical protein
VRIRTDTLLAVKQKPLQQAATLNTQLTVIIIAEGQRISTRLSNIEAHHRHHVNSTHA